MTGYGPEYCTCDYCMPDKYITHEEIIMLIMGEIEE